MARGIELEPALAEVLHCGVGLLQIDAESEQAWPSDLSQYLQDEDPDSFAVTVRVAARQFLEETLGEFSDRALEVLDLHLGHELSSSPGRGRGHR